MKPYRVSRLIILPNSIGMLPLKLFDEKFLEIYRSKSLASTQELAYTPYLK